MTTIETLSFVYLGNEESWRGLPMTMHFFVYVCHFSMKRFTIGVREIADIRDAKSWDKSLEWATKTRAPSY